LFRQVQEAAAICVKLAAVALVLSVLSACAGKMDAASPGIDDTIRTGSVLPGDWPEGPEIGSDAATIRNAVTSADLPALTDGTLAWANAETGTHGTISRIEEYMDAGDRCRRFLASRRNYDGVLLYRGEACLSGGSWRMRDFAPADS